jgi:hypothetical protein
VVSPTAIGGGDDGKLTVQRDSTSQKALVVYGGAGASAQLVRIYDSTGSIFWIASDGATVLNRATSLAAAITTSKRTTVADTTYTILVSDYYVAVTSLSAPRTLTLPSASTAGAGFRLIVKDESGAAGTHNITVARSGSQTIDGATNQIISTNYGVLRLISTGSNWSVI